MPFIRFIAPLVAAALCAAGAVHAQAKSAPDRTMYKCPGAKGKVTYSEKACEGGTVVERKSSKTDARAQKPPQDRAVAANRARLTPEQRQQCDVLKGRMAEQEAVLKARPQPAAPEDERELTTTRKEYREMKCA